VPTATGRLKLVLTDIEGRPLRESVDVFLQHTTLSSAAVRTRLPAGKSALITGLHQQPEGTYRIEVDPPSYLPVSRFIVIKRRRFRRGTWRLTFFARGDQWLADIDIDDANGIAHMFQVLRNAITGRPTHPFDVRELLVSYQKLDPGYALIV
jgi:hypothetical protein